MRIRWLNQKEMLYGSPFTFMPIKISLSHIDIVINNSVVKNIMCLNFSMYPYIVLYN